MDNRYEKVLSFMIIGHRMKYFHVAVFSNKVLLGAAYLIKYGIKKQDIVLHQGRFVGRPSEIKVLKNNKTYEIEVMGDVAILVSGCISNVIKSDKKLNSILELGNNNYE